MRSIFLCEDLSQPGKVYAPETTAALVQEAGLEETVYDKAAVLAEPDAFRDVEFIFSTWGMPSFTETEIRKCFPKLQCVFYGAGSVQSFARPFLNLGIRVFSAWAANGVPVAEYTVSQIILANKGFFRACAAMSTGKKAEANQIKASVTGSYGAKVGIIGAGMIGKLVIRMLKNYNLPVLVFDPFLPDETARELGVVKTDLPTLFSSCQVVSNHLANNPQTQGMLTGALFARMKPNAVFLNTGRGAQVVEADLAAVLESRPDLTAVLDVTFPEPPQPDHPFYRLPNCFLTPHIAGSLGDEICRMSEYMLEEFRLVSAGKEVRYEVSLSMLQTMA